MALIREACGKRDFRKGGVGGSEAVAGEFDPQIANVIADCATMNSTKDARQV